MKKKLFSFLIILPLFSGLIYAKEQNLGQIDYILLLKSSLVMMAILAVSVISLIFLLERTFYFLSIKFSSTKIMKQVELMLKEQNVDVLLNETLKKNNPLNNVIKLIITNREKNKEELEELYEIARVKEKENMEKFLVLIGSSAAISPLLGLLGTVTGIIQAFSDLAASGTGGPSVIASGVSEALVTTAFGLIISIPMLVAFNFFSNKIKIVLSELDVNMKYLFFMLNKK